MINQKINPIMGFDDVEVLFKTTNVSDATFTPRRLKTGDMVIGFWLRAGSILFNSEDNIRLRFDGGSETGTNSRTVGSQGCAGVVAQKLAAPATTATVTAGSTTSGVVKNVLLVVVPSELFPSNQPNNDEVGSAFSASSFISVNVNVTANKPVFCAGIQNNTDPLSFTNLGEQATIFTTVSAGDRIIVGTTTSPTTSNDGVTISLSGTSNVNKGFAAAALT